MTDNETKSASVQSEPQKSDNLDEKYEQFKHDLTVLINYHSMETASGTPDFILAEFLTNALAAYDSASLSNTAWRK